MAIGAATTAGLKGWYYSKIEFGSNPVITLSDKQPSVILGYLSGGEWSSGTPNIKVGDKISIVNNSKYDYCGEVKSISNNKVTLKSALPFDKLDTGLISLNNPDDWSIYLPDNEYAGIIDFGGGALSEGVNTKSTNIGSHAEGIQTHAYGQYSHTEGRETKAGYAAHAEGWETVASGEDSHSEGYSTIASGKHSHAEGAHTIAEAAASHAEGEKTTASGNRSHSEGYNTTASGSQSHSEGNGTVASNNQSHAEGNITIASGKQSHAEGLRTTASGLRAHTEGQSTEAKGSESHAEGLNTKAIGDQSHAEGYGTETNNTAEHACGIYNKSTKSYNASQATQFSIGIGTSNTDRKNGFEVKQNGDTYLCIGGQLYFVTPITDNELNELFND